MNTADFSGSDYDPRFDRARLTGQLKQLTELMADGRWRTLHEIEVSTGIPAASASAQLRNLRKAQFGSHTIEKRVRGNREAGLFEYRIAPAQQERQA